MTEKQKTLYEAVQRILHKMIALALLKPAGYVEDFNIQAAALRDAVNTFYS